MNPVFTPPGALKFNQRLFMRWKTPEKFFERGELVSYKTKGTREGLKAELVRGQSRMSRAPLLKKSR